MAVHEFRVDRTVPQRGKPVMLVGAHAQFPAVIVVLDHGRFVFGVADPERVVERLSARPVVQPAFRKLAERLDHGVLDAPVEAGAGVVAGTAGFHQERVELGQHEEQDAARLLPVLGRRTVGGGDPVFDQAREILCLHVPVAHAQEHGRQLLLGDIAIEEIGDLAAEEELGQRRLAGGKIVPEVVGEPVAGSGEVEKIGL